MLSIPTPSSLPRRLAALLLVLLPWLGAVPAPAGAEILSSKERNYSVEVPDGWTRESVKPSWEKDGIVDGAKRLLDKTYDGKPARGQGAQVHVSVLPAPEGKTAAELAEDPAQREFLMRMFGAQADWPKPELAETTVKGETGGEVTGVRLTAKGTGLNLQAEAGPCHGMLVLLVLNKRLYRLRLVAWTTQHDDESLKSDIDSIEINFMLIDAAAEKVKGPRPEMPPGTEPEEEKLPGDAGEEKVVEDEAQGWRFKKPRLLETKEIDKEVYQYAVSSLEANDRNGSVSVMISVYPNGLVTNGQKVPDQDIRKWVTTSWWGYFLANHPEGAIQTFDWPSNRPNQSFLVLPLFEKPIMVAETPKKRDLEPSSSDLEKKRIAEGVKGTIGKEKAGEAWRGVLKGSRPRVGDEVTVRYGWRTPRFTYMINISFARDGHVKYGPAVAALLQGFEILK